MRELKRRRLAPGDELGLVWERWADGRAWRLKRKRDFGDVHPNLAREAARNAAVRMGKVVKVTRDKVAPEKYTWVQFAEYEIDLGDPCPCGSRRLFRVHPFFARCAQCHAQLLISELSVALQEEEDDSPSSEETLRSATTLEELDDVHLSRIAQSGGHARYCGYGLDGSLLVLLIADFHLPRGELPSEENALDRVATVREIALDDFAGMVDASALLRRPESDWDIVL